MPSPIAHVTAGYVIYELARHRWPALDGGRLGPLPRLLVMSTGASLLPDIDSAAGVLAGDFGRFHNTVTHSLVVGLGVTGIFAVIMGWRRRDTFWPWFVVALAGYELHVLMDAATFGRGVMALWPLSEMRFQVPVMLFYGLHWSNGLFSERHLITLATEAGFVALVLIALHGLRRRQARDGT